jgi:hypothetical protein
MNCRILLVDGNDGGRDASRALTRCCAGASSVIALTVARRPDRKPCRPIELPEGGASERRPEAVDYRGDIPGRRRLCPLLRGTSVASPACCTPAACPLDAVSVLVPTYEPINNCSKAEPGPLLKGGRRPKRCTVPSASVAHSALR